MNALTLKCNGNHGGTIWARFAAKRRFGVLGLAAAGVVLRSQTQ